MAGSLAVAISSIILNKTGEPVVCWKLELLKLGLLPRLDAVHSRAKLQHFGAPRRDTPVELSGIRSASSNRMHA